MKLSRSVAFVTLGCEKNSVDSEVMMGLVAQKGYDVTENPEDADVIIVNTCAFIEAAKEESVNTILSMADLKAMGKKLVVAGCMAQRYADQLLEEIPEIDGLVGTGEFTRVNEVMDEIDQGKRPVYIGNPAYIYDEFTPRKSFEQGPSAYIKIAEGCDHACTFCVIPQMRGAFRSRSIESIVAEAQKLAQEGVREINLIAQDTTHYGLDIYKEKSLAKLLTALNDVEGIEWIRLHYAYPGSFDDTLIKAFRDLKKVVKYIDMPLQHSEDHLLKAMQRPGRQKHIRQLIEKIRCEVPDVVFRSSFIVGFPGETQEDFDALKQFVREIGFDHIGVFTYSPEETAPSSTFADQVDAMTKERRASELMEVAREVASARMERYIGQVVPVLIERIDDDVEGQFVGRMPYDAKEIDGVVYVKGQGIVIGSILPVQISHSLDFDLVGEVM